VNDPLLDLIAERHCSQMASVSVVIPRRERRLGNRPPCIEAGCRMYYDPLEVARRCPLMPCFNPGAFASRAHEFFEYGLVVLLTGGEDGKHPLVHNLHQLPKNTLGAKFTDGLYVADIADRQAQAAA
jgi:hypothetical protein